jgi:hypothetical protein
MDTALWVLLIAVVVFVVAAAVGLWFTMQKRRSERLQRDFGPEYDRAVGEYGSRREAEAKLSERKQRVERLKLRTLSKEERDRFGSQWSETQAQFVDDPQAAVRNAQQLIDAAMRARGFPLSDFDRRAEDISVEHPHVVENYRSARDIAELNDRGDADTEDLRQGMVHFRELFVELTNSGGDVPRVKEDRDRDQRGVDMRSGVPRGR